MKIFVKILFAMCVSSSAWAGLDVGIAQSSVLAGRLQPGLYLGYEGASIAYSIYSVGVQNPLYYHSAWTTSMRWKIRNDTFLGGRLVGSFGFGAHFAKKGYRDTEAADLEETSDGTAGPAFRAQWNIVSGLELGIEGLYGLIQPQNLVQLSTQDIVHLTFGWSF